MVGTFLRHSVDKNIHSMDELKQRPMEVCCGRAVERHTDDAAIYHRGEKNSCLLADIVSIARGISKDF